MQDGDKPIRKALSKKTRFEVFKRDLFTCQYCGAHPPGVLLHVDHVLAVSNGGGNDRDNLTTACEPCNLGKGARSLAAVPESLSEKAKRVAEADAQLLGYQAILEAKRARIDAEMWRVADALDTASSTLGMDKRWLAGIRNFIDKLGLHKVLDATDIARRKFPYGGQKTFLYFCGICWKEIRGEGEQKDA